MYLTLDRDEARELLELLNESDEYPALSKVEQNLKRMLQDESEEEDDEEEELAV